MATVCAELNERRTFRLSGDVIMLRVGHRLQKLKPDKSGPALEHISGVVLFSEIHKLKFTDGTMAAAAIPESRRA